jgi:hypothetical protein
LRVIRRSTIHAWNACLTLNALELQRVVMDKTPSFEVLSRYTKPLLPTSCQQQQVLVFKREFT